MTEEGRIAYSRRNIIYGFFQVAVKRLLPFAVRTILIYRFGVNYLGLNSVFASVLSVLSLMELGFGTAIVYSLYKPVAEGNTEQICAYLAYYRKIYRIIGLTILGVGLLVMPFLNMFIHDVRIPGDLNLYVYYLIFLGNTVISYLLYGYMTAVPTAYQRKDLLSRIDICVSVMRCLIQAVVLLLSNNIYLYLAAMPLMTVVQNLFTAYVVLKKYPEIKCKGVLNSEQKRELGKKTYGLLVTRVMAVSRNSVDTLCLSAFFTLSLTGIYHNYYYIMSSVLSLTYVIGQSITPSVGNSIATESREKNYSDMREFDFLYMAVAGGMTACMLCLYQPFIRLWTGEGMMLETPVAVAMCVYFYILESGAIHWVYILGAGLWYECRLIMIGEATANLVLNILLCKIWGVGGIVLATVITVFTTNFLFFPRISFKFYFKNGKLKEYWADHAKYTATALVTAGVSWVACEKLLPMGMINGMREGLFCLGGRALLCIFSSVVVFWTIWHRNSLCQMAMKRLKMMVFLRGEKYIDSH
ncbi:MAG: hypothetical protein IKF90_26145 [Parasporobacterium sp.]|nr:hypothetical protein [Parasporobacterium sp.]